MDSTKTKKWDKKRQSEYHKEYRKNHKKRLDDYHKNWEMENPEYRKNYYEENREIELQRNKEWRDANPEKVKNNWDTWYQMNKQRSPRRRFTESKNKAKKRGIEWLLSFEEYSELIKLPCYYCENQLGEPVKRSSGLDRLDSNGDYEPTNVVSCCYTCNCIKNEFLTPEETKVAVKSILEFRRNKLLSGS